MKGRQYLHTKYMHAIFNFWPLQHVHVFYQWNWGATIFSEDEALTPLHSCFNFWPQEKKWWNREVCFIWFKLIFINSSCWYILDSYHGYHFVPNVKSSVVIYTYLSLLHCYECYYAYFQLKYKSCPNNISYW